MYIVAINHSEVSNKLSRNWNYWKGTTPPGFTAFAVIDTVALHQIIQEIWNLSKELPLEAKDPLVEFKNRTRNYPSTTEAERQIIQRVGQDLFRELLLEYWGGQCAITGIATLSLLRASHIKPWSECESDAERLDVYNGLLLVANLDAAFDKFLVSFSEIGQIIFSDRLPLNERKLLGFHDELKLRQISHKHFPSLSWHRDRMAQLDSDHLIN